MKKEPKVDLQTPSTQRVVNIRFIEPVMLGNNCEVHSALNDKSVVDSYEVRLKVSEDSRFIIVEAGPKVKSIVPMSNVASMLVS